MGWRMQTCVCVFSACVKSQSQKKVPMYGSPSFMMNRPWFPGLIGICRGGADCRGGVPHPLGPRLAPGLSALASAGSSSEWTGCIVKVITIQHACQSSMHASDRGPLEASD